MCIDIHMSWYTRTRILSLFCFPLWLRSALPDRCPTWLYCQKNDDYDGNAKYKGRQESGAAWNCLTFTTTTSAAKARATGAARVKVRLRPAPGNEPVNCLADLLTDVLHVPMYYEGAGLFKVFEFSSSWKLRIQQSLGTKILWILHSLFVPFINQGREFLSLKSGEWKRDNWQLTMANMQCRMQEETKAFMNVKRVELVVCYAKFLKKSV